VSAEDLTVDFAGHTAFVTGAAQGIGKATALALAHRGAYVVATDVSMRGLSDLREELAQRDLPGEVRALDVSDAAAVDKVIGEVEQRRPISLLASVAGVLYPSPVLALPADRWRATFAVNCDGVFHLCQAVGRRMAERRAGAIAVVSSNAARTPRVEMSAYAASKAACSMFVRCLGLELAPLGVRCNVVAPGSTDTPMQRALWRDERDAERVIAGVPERYRVGIPLARMAEPDDVVEAILFLLSDRARQITMHELVVDGGATLGV
jgi:2,3-dihydro-2,3-dihydroxybenzoate dehydrogenase